MNQDLLITNDAWLRDRNRRMRAAIRALLNNGDDPHARSVALELVNDDVASIREHRRATNALARATTRRPTDVA